MHIVKIQFFNNIKLCKQLLETALVSVVDWSTTEMEKQHLTAKYKII